MQVIDELICTQNNKQIVIQHFIPVAKMQHFLQAASVYANIPQLIKR